MNELLLAGIAAGGGVAVGGLVYLLFRKRLGQPVRQETEMVTLEVLSEETVVPAPAQEAAFAAEDAPFAVARVPAVRPGPVPVPVATRGLRPTYDPDDPPELPDSPIPTEWARRQVGPVDQGRMKGVCSGCGTNLSVSVARPLRIACPVCGRTRLLAA